MLTGALGWAVAFMPVSPSSALRIPDAGPDDSHSPPYLHQPLHDGGRDTLALQRILGHSSITMTMRYAHLSPEHLASAMSLSPLSQVKHFASQVHQ